MSMDYMEDGHLSKSEQKLRTAKIAKLNKQFDDNYEDIALAQLIVNRESAVALANYRVIRERRRKVELAKENDPALCIVERRVS